MVMMNHLDVLKSSGMEFGVLFVMTFGTWLMLGWSAVNWASEMPVKLPDLHLMELGLVSSGLTM